MILLQNHFNFNGGCVTVVEDIVNDKTKEEEKIRIDDIFTNPTYDDEINLDKIDLANEDIDTNCNFYDDPNEEVG